MSETNQTRRDFLKGSAGVAAGAAAAGLVLPASGVFAQSSDTIRLALVGAGGRGAGAAAQAMSTKGEVKLVAVADAFEDNARSSLRALKSQFGGKVDVGDDHVFSGFDAYK